MPSDYGERFADGRLRYIDNRLSHEYLQARKDLEKTLADFVRKSAERDKLKQKQRDAGLITEDEYQDWLAGQVFQKKRWESKLKQVQQIIYEHNEQAAKIVYQNKVEVFTENYNHQAYQAEKETGISFDILNEQALAKLIKENPQILPEWEIDKKKDYKWNYRKASNAITQGIIQGESVDKIAKRLAANLATDNKKKMQLFARTAITGAQNAGVQQQMNDAAKVDDIEQLKEWVATLDRRTRDSHRHLDGKQVPYDKPFKSDFGDIEYPGDPSAHPGDVYNCRCRMIVVYPKYQNMLSPAERWNRLGNMSYEEWKNVKRLGATDRPINKYLQPQYSSQDEHLLSLFDVKRINGEHSIEDDAKAVNPNYDPFDFGTSQNCQRCVNAYVARRRGFDVEAQRIMSADDHYALGSNYKECYNTSEKPKHLATSIFEKGLTHEEVRNRFENYMNGRPDGTIVIIDGYWETTGSGHVFIAERRNGKTVYVDPQNPKSDPENYFDRMAPKSTYYFDTTGIPFNSKIMDLVVKR